MSSAVAPYLPRPFVRSLAPAKAADRSLERRVMLAWGLLLFNVLSWAPEYDDPTHTLTVGKAITQGSCRLALLVA